MTASELFAALDLPAGALVQRRVPKTLLVEHGAPTAADKRKIHEGVERVQWIATLKPTTAGVAAYRNEVREYLEIAVLRLTLRANAKRPRLIELVHRATPYPLVVVTEHDEGVNLSLAHKRWSHGEAGKTVLDGRVVAVEWQKCDESHRSDFLAALELGNQLQASLYALYQGWIDTLHALEAARRTKAFTILTSADDLAARRLALQDCDRLEAEIVRLRTAAAKEKQMSRQVELNLELKRVEAEMTAALAKL